MNFKYLSLTIFLYSLFTSNLLGQSLTIGSNDGLRTNGRIQMVPEYPGGVDAFYTYIFEQYRFPESAAKAGVSGKLIASFVVDIDGDLRDVNLMRDPGYGTGEELRRVLQWSQRWRSGRMNGRDIPVQFVLSLTVSPAPPKAARANVPEVSILPITKKDNSPILPVLKASPGNVAFENKIERCQIDTFRRESVKIALTDRFSMLQSLTEGIPADSLKKLSGRIAFQVLIDSSAAPCLLSVSNDLNVSYKSLGFVEAIRKTKWSLSNQGKGAQTPVSVILVLTFTEDRMTYQRMASDGDEQLTKVLESSEKGKFSRY